MKLPLLLTLLLFSLQTPAYTMHELEGKYKVSSTVMRMENIMTVNGAGALNISEQDGHSSCSGISKLKDNVIHAEVRCKDFYENIVFKFKVNLSKVSDLNNFKAPLAFPMIGETIWHFERLEN